MFAKLGDMLKAKYDNGYWVTADHTYWIVLNDTSTGKTGMIGVIGYDCKQSDKDVRLELMIPVVNVMRKHFSEFGEMDVHDRAKRLRRLVEQKRINPGRYLEFYEVNKKQFYFHRPLVVTNQEGIKYLQRLGD